MITVPRFHAIPFIPQLETVEQLSWFAGEVIPRVRGLVRAPV